LAHGEPRGKERGQSQTEKQQESRTEDRERETHAKQLKYFPEQRNKILENKDKTLKRRKDWLTKINKKGRNTKRQEEQKTTSY